MYIEVLGVTLEQTDLGELFPFAIFFRKEIFELDKKEWLWYQKVSGGK